jgi:hypothetical protein
MIPLADAVAAAEASIFSFLVILVKNIISTDIIIMAIGQIRLIFPLLVCVTAK